MDPAFLGTFRRSFWLGRANASATIFERREMIRFINNLTYAAIVGGGALIIAMFGGMLAEKLTP